MTDRAHVVFLVWAGFFDEFTPIRDPRRRAPGPDSRGGTLRRGGGARRTRGSLYVGLAHHTRRCAAPGTAREDGRPDGAFRRAPVLPHWQSLPLPPRGPRGAPRHARTARAVGLASRDTRWPRSAAYVAGLAP